uniref:TGF-beta family profile domain-containing protein n=1 Tax=Pelodiscus sinensis TaxID=13735 RepID=K7GDQ7_PELSI
VEHDRDIFSQKPYWKEFRFDLTQIPTGESVTAAEFRIYKLRSFIRDVNKTLHIGIYEIMKEHSNRESDLFLLDLQELQAGVEGWLVFNTNPAVCENLFSQHLFGGRNVCFRPTAGHSIDPGLAGLLGRRGPRSKQPFMVTFFRASQNPVRVTRAVKQLRKRQPKKTNDLPHPNKLPGIFDDIHVSEGRQVCRRHELYVSFQDLGWLDWVIAPQGYSAFYCEGDCAFPLDSCMNATNHAILQSLIGSRWARSPCLDRWSMHVHLMKPEAVPKACCAPTKLSATSVLYYDSNNNVILKKHRNMVVKSCGCH